MTQRSSTVAVAAILAAVELNDDDCEVLMRALVCVLGVYDFDPLNMLLKTWDQLKYLVDENKDDIDELAFEV